MEKHHYIIMIVGLFLAYYYYCCLSKVENFSQKECSRQQINKAEYEYVVNDINKDRKPN
jgi:hypothetical protein